MRTSLALLLVIACIAGCTPKTPTVVVNNAEEASQTLAKIRDLSEEPLLKVNAGTELTDEDTRKLEETLPLAQALVDYDPTQIGAVSLRGKIETALGKSEEAEATYRQAIKLKPANPSPEMTYLIADLHNELGKISFSKQNYKAALDDISQAVSLVPNEPRFLFNLASVQVEADQLREAKATLAKVLELDPKNQDALDLRKLISLSEK